MDHPIAMHLPADVFMALLHHVGEGYYGDKTETVLSDIVRQWLAATETAPAARAVAGDEAASSRGYQWKQLFLPNGTELRATFQGYSTYAKVEDEKIICDGAGTTPSRLVNTNGCGTRNAWQSIWLRFPGTVKWELAARCRDAA